MFPAGNDQDLTELRTAGRSIATVAFPRILLAVPLLVAGLVLPAAAQPTQAPGNAVGMVHEMFAVDTVHVRRGQTLTLANSSLFVHIIGPGRDGTITDNPGVPIKGRHLMQTDEVYTTPKWNTAGTFYLTCSVHPEMTLKVVVAN
jgi:plastocyanin